MKDSDRDANHIEGRTKYLGRKVVGLFLIIAISAKQTMAL